MANYTAKDITVLEGLEPVRKRPGMYIGGGGTAGLHHLVWEILDNAGDEALKGFPSDNVVRPEPARERPVMYIGGVGTAGLHHLVWEILDNAVDEAMNGFASNIVVTLHADGSSITISDDGRGIPVDKHPKTKKSALEVIFTVLHAGGKFEQGNYKTAGGLHGVGASVVNALSTELRATVKRDGSQWEMVFKRGKPTGPIKKAGAARGSGTTVYFHPDSTIFPKVEFDAAMIRERLEVLSYIHKGVKVTFGDESGGTKGEFQHEEGLSDFLRKIIAARSAKPVHETAFLLERESGP